MLSELDTAFLQDVADGLKSIYKSADQMIPKQIIDCPATAKDLWPHTRRALIEAHIKNLGVKYPGTVPASKPNKSRNCSHLEIKFGKLLLTQSHVTYIDEPVRPAYFRQRLAASSWAYLPSFNFEYPDPGNYIYGVLKHGGEDPAAVNFFCLEIPVRRSLDTCLRIDLTHMLGIEMAPNFQPEIIRDGIAASIRPTIKIAKQSGQE